MNPEWLVGRKMFMRKYRTQNGLCALCSMPFAPEVMTRDHIIPRSKGGGTQWDNIQLACAPCNERKGDRLAEFSQKIERGEGLTMSERLERQGIIFNHSGDISKVKIQIT